MGQPGAGFSRAPHHLVLSASRRRRRAVQHRARSRAKSVRCSVAVPAAAAASGAQPPAAPGRPRHSWPADSSSPRRSLPAGRLGVCENLSRGAPVFGALMRLARLLSVLLAILAAATLARSVRPPPTAVPAARLRHRQRRRAQRRAARTCAVRPVEQALQRPPRCGCGSVCVGFVRAAGRDGWATNTRTVSDLTDSRRDLAIAAGTARMRSWCCRRTPVAVRPRSTTSGSATRSTRAADQRLDRRRGERRQQPGCHGSTGSGVRSLSLVPLLIIGAVILLLVALLLLWMPAGGGASSTGRRSPPSGGLTDPNALAAVPVDALDDLLRARSSSTSTTRCGISNNELELAVEEFGQARPSRLAKAVEAAKSHSGASLQRAAATRRRGAGDPGRASRPADPSDRRGRAGQPGARDADRGLPPVRPGDQRG